MRSVGRYWWILALSMMGLSVVAGFALYTSFMVKSEWIGSICLILFFLAFIGLVASGIFTPLLCYIRYYKHFCTDEGYLTFTLPVRRRDLLHSKILNTLIWTTLHTIWSLLCASLVAMIAMSADIFGGHDFFELLGSAGRGIAEIYELGGAWMWVYTIEALLIVLAAPILSINLVHFCITLGAVVAKRLKFLAAIGFYYAFNAVLTGIIQFALLFSAYFIEGFSYELEGVSEPIGLLSVAICLFGILMMVVTISALLYSMTRRGLERKLNLA
jgi:hypothetical protein